MNCLPSVQYKRDVNLKKYTKIIFFFSNVVIPFEDTKILELNSNKAGIFEGSLSWGKGGLNLTPASYFKKNLF